MLVKVDPLAAEAPQATVDRLADVGGGSIEVPVAVGRPGMPGLGGDEYSAAHSESSQESADERLVDPERLGPVHLVVVAVSRVEQGDPCVKRGPHRQLGAF